MLIIAEVLELRTTGTILSVSLFEIIYLNLEEQGTKIKEKKQILES
jgi:hypothetical protein